MNLTVRHVLTFRTEEENAYTVPMPTLAFVLAGLDYMESPGFRVKSGATGLFFHPQGLPIRFRFTERRENYAILFACNAIRGGAVPGRAEIRNEGAWFSVPLFVPVETGRLEGWRLELERMRTAFLMPTAKNRLRVELGVFNMLRYLMDETTVTIGISAAEHLKSLIDADSSASRSMHDLCAACDYSPDHLRILFRRQFGTTPKQYHIRRRMVEAMESITGSRQSIKEIAWRLGFTQVSHFSAAFKIVHGLTPREAVRRFRGTSA